MVIKSTLNEISQLSKAICVKYNYSKIILRAIKLNPRLIKDKKKPKHKQNKNERNINKYQNKKVFLHC